MGMKKAPQNDLNPYLFKEDPIRDNNTRATVDT
jgi:hypothetical protein